MPSATTNRALERGKVCKGRGQAQPGGGLYESPLAGGRAVVRSAVLGRGGHRTRHCTWCSCMLIAAGAASATSPRAGAGSNFGVGQAPWLAPSRCQPLDRSRPGRPGLAMPALARRNAYGKLP